MIVQADVYIVGSDKNNQQRVEDFFAAARQVDIAGASHFGDIRNACDNALVEHQLRSIAYYAIFDANDFLQTAYQHSFSRAK
mgnify:CR=1 FL=1